MFFLFGRHACGSERAHALNIWQARRVRLSGRASHLAGMSAVLTAHERAVLSLGRHARIGSGGSVRNEVSESRFLKLSF